MLNHRDEETPEERSSKRPRYETQPSESEQSVPLTPFSEAAVVLTSFRNDTTEDFIPPAPAKKHLFTLDKRKVSKQELATLIEEGKGTNIKRYVLINGNKTRVYTANQLSHNRLFIDEKTPVTDEQRTTLTEEVTGKDIKRFVCINDNKTRVYTADQLSHNRLFIDEKTRVTNEQRVTLTEEGKGQNIKRYVLLNGNKTLVYTATQL